MNDIVGDSAGFLWLCTRDGLSRFDGTTFVNYGLQQGLPHSTVNHFLEAPDGTRWVATNGGGVARLLPDRSAGSAFAPYDVGDTLMSRRVNMLHIDTRNDLWAATDRGLFRLPGAAPEGSFEPVLLAEPGGDEPRVWSLAGDAGGGLWIGTETGLWRRRSDGVVQRDLHGITGRINALTTTADGTLWLGTGAGLAQLPPGQSGEAGLRLRMRGTVRSLRILADGRLAFDVSGRLGMLDGEVLEVYGDSQGVHDVRAVGEDHGGNIWLGTYQGAIQIVRGGLRTFAYDDGLGRAQVLPDETGRERATPRAATRVHAIQQAANGDMLVVSGRWTLNRLEGDRFISVRPAVPAEAVPRWASRVGFRDTDGRWWLLTSGGLLRFDPAPLETLDGRPPDARFVDLDGLDGRWVVAIHQDRHGRIWLGVRGDEPGVVRWDPATGRFQNLGQDHGLPPGRSGQAFTEDGTGRMWVGFYNGGLARWTGERFEDLSSLPGAPRGGVHALMTDHAGRLWIAATGDGLVMVPDPGSPRPAFTSYGTDQGLPSQNVRCLAEDLRGRVYAGTPSGVVRLDPGSGSVRVFTTDHGLANNFTDVAFRDAEGRLWFGTMRGLSRLTPGPDAASPPPPVLISRLHAGGRLHPLPELGAPAVRGPVLGPGRGQLLVEYFAIDFSPGTNLRFRSRIRGDGAGWSEPSPQRTLRLASLSPGRYHLEIQAVGPGAAGAGPPATVEFRVLPPLWRRWWAILLAAGLLAAAATAFHRYRLARLLELERVRTRIATDLHDDIGSSLSEIAILSELARRQPRKPSHETLSEIARVSREVIDTLSDIVWAIHPARDRLGDLVQRMHRFAGHVLPGSDIRFLFQRPAAAWPRRLRPALRREVFLIFKEAINNAVRHAGCSEVRIHLALEGRHLVLTVEDDGHGFEPSSVERGHGLQSMDQRARRLGGRLEVASRPGSGTRVTVRLPLARPRTALGG